MTRMLFSLTIVAISCLLPYSVRAADRLKLEKDTLDQILAPDKYDPSVRPLGKNGTAGPVIVKTNLFVRSISQIDDVKMEYKIQLTFRQEWTDSRLMYDDKRGKLKYLTVSDPGRLWKPDTFFSNEKDGHSHELITPNVLLRIKPTGHVLFSIRVSMTLSCSMNLKNYPMDNQVCSVVMASYAYTTDDIVFEWKEPNSVQMASNIFLPQFKLIENTPEYCTSKTSTGEYSCLKLDFLFSRELNSFLVRIYIPHTMLVLLSWLPFWLDYRAKTPRMAIWLTILLTMTIMMISIQYKVPDVAYTKAIDVWSGICLTFLCAVIIELVLVMQSVEQEEKLRIAALEAQDTLEKPLMSIDDHAEGKDRATTSKFGRFKKWLNRYQSRGQRIDVISRFCFPLAFALFNLFYWSSYMIKD